MSGAAGDCAEIGAIVAEEEAITKPDAPGASEEFRSPGQKPGTPRSKIAQHKITIATRRCHLDDAVRLISQP